MAVVCNEYFSVSSLSDWSYETEIAYSTLCVPNQLKAAVFLIFLVGFLILLTASLVFIARRVRNGKTWTWKTRCIFFYALSQLCKEHFFFLILSLFPSLLHLSISVYFVP